ncbi:MAG TPA: efflux RND transporter permease subunit [Opitutaceae bacterium]|nr:efflux RND transporter permease subunit [Lacunisphaera sp.]HWA09133.1 efflux RND transporter permease subunit [Opitutaceae bacterium]
MLNRLIEFSLRNRLFVLVASVLLLIYGGYTILQLPVDVFPDLNRPTVNILTEAAGLAPEEVETLVNLPMETSLNGAPGVKRVRSSAGVGLSVLFVEFDWGTDIYRARQLVQERLQLAADKLPRGVTPTMGPISSIMGEIMLIGLKSDTGVTAPMDIRSLADWNVRQRLLAIPGVSQVIPIGGGVKQYQVLPSPEKLAAYGVTLEEVTTAAAKAQSNTSGGFLETANREALIRNLGRTTSLDDIANSLVAMRHGIPVRLRDVADVQFGRQVMRGDAGVNAKPAVIVSVQKQPGVDTVGLTRKVEAALVEIGKTLPPDVKVYVLFKQANFIEAAIQNVEEAIRDGAIIVVIVLFLFLLNFRTTAITLTAIPLSFVVTGLYFKFADISINTMTLGGLAVAIGMVVDDAIVGVENVYRRLRENRHTAQPRPFLRVIADASSEVRNSILYATLVIILVFIPLFALGGIEGRLFAPIGVATIVAMLASFIVSLTVIPALSSYLLPKMKRMDDEKDGWLVRGLKWLDERLLLRPAMRHPWIVMTLAFLLVAGAFALYPSMGKLFLPDFNEGTSTINVVSAPGTSLAESDRIGTIAETLLLSVPEVISTGRRTGRAELDEHAEGVHSTEIDVDFKKSARGREVILAEIRAKLGQIPGIVLNVGQPISHRLDHLLSGVSAQIAVKIFGPDLDKLRLYAAETQGLLKGVPGLVDLQTEKQVLIDQVKIQVNREKAAAYGLQTGQLNELLETTLDGRVVGDILEGQRTYDLVVRLNEPSRANVAVIREILIDTPVGGKVPLYLVADVRESKGPNLINHEDVQRRIAVSANVSGRDLGAVVTEIQKTLGEKLHLETGYFVSYEGQFQSQQEATRIIALLAIFTFGMVFLVLYSHFRSGMIVGQILLNIPLAFIGALVLTYFMVGKVSIATLVGLITLAGIASRNTIMMISHYLHLMEHEGEKFDEHMIVRGSLERLVPVTMTALTAGLALIPLVLAADQPGKEILYPVAVVILGGLVSSTFLDMAVTPAVFFKFGRKASEKYLARAKVDPLDAAS